MNEKITIVWKIITLSGFLLAGIFFLIDLSVDRTYKKLRKENNNGTRNRR
ncbi:MAG: hypothetical protein ACLSHH_08510 [Clostridia bacterium]